MSAVHAPYNFVPLSGKVFLPEWGDQISHDVPFSDGLSGILEVRITAATPLCVGDRRDRDGVLQPFQDADGIAAIPGSSIRGMLRNVAEVASFARMQFVDIGRRYAVRDLTQGAEHIYRHHIRNVEAGWLCRRPACGDEDDSECYTIEPCKMVRVHKQELFNLIREHGKDPTRFERLFATKCTAKMKDEAWPEGVPRELQVPEEPNNPKEIRHLQPGRGGWLVFTGQAAGNKKREFLFCLKRESQISVPAQVIKDFEQNHSRANTENHPGDDGPNEQLSYCMQLLKRDKRAPVFFLREGSEVVSLGLAYMYRLAYRHSIGETLEHSSPDHHRKFTGSDARPDLAEALFGRVRVNEGHDANGDFSLRCRVAVGMFRSDGTAKLCGPWQSVLSQPKATFYPAYVRQPGAEDGRLPGQYVTYMDEDAELRGWKRYPTRESAVAAQAAVGEKGAAESRWMEWASGTSFIGRIRFHNLRPAELGALLWCLDFGGRAECRHSLGHAKPLGRGVVKAMLVASEVEDVKGNPAALTLEECGKRFEEVMEVGLAPGSLLRSEQLFQLLAMANPANATDAGRKLSYMSLDRREFQEAKNQHAVLPEYAVLPSDSMRDREIFRNRGGRQAKQRQRSRLTPAALFAELHRICDNPVKSLNDVLRLASLVIPGQWTFTEKDYKMAMGECLKDTIAEIRRKAKEGEGAAQREIENLLKERSARPDYMKGGIDHKIAKEKKKLEKEAAPYRKFIDWLDQGS